MRVIVHNDEHWLNAADLDFRLRECLTAMQVEEITGGPRDVVHFEIPLVVEPAPAKKPRK